jgi:hypothetical protein
MWHIDPELRPAAARCPFSTQALSRMFCAIPMPAKSSNKTMVGSKAIGGKDSKNLLRQNLKHHPLEANTVFLTNR